MSSDHDYLYDEVQRRILRSSRAARQSYIDAADPDIVLNLKEDHAHCLDLAKLFVRIARNGLRADSEMQQSVRSHGERLRELVLRCGEFYKLDRRSRQIIERILTDHDPDIVRATNDLYNLVADATKGLRRPSLLELVARAADE